MSAWQSTTHWVDENSRNALSQSSGNPELLKSGSVISACYHRLPPKALGQRSLLASQLRRLLAIPGTPCLCPAWLQSLPSLDMTFFPVCLSVYFLQKHQLFSFRIHPIPDGHSQVLCIHASPGYGQVLSSGHSSVCIAASFWLYFVVPWCLLMLSIISHTYWSVRNLPW